MDADHVASTYIGVGRGGREGLGPRWNLKILAKKVVFLVTSCKKQILPLMVIPRKILEKSPGSFLEKILPTLMST